MATPLLAAALIVKDEAANLPDCLTALEGLRPLLDHVVVYDTGSSDDSVEIARRFGARVERGFWDGDFARARNAAADLAEARWVLSVDADERVVANQARLRETLRAGLRPGSELDALWVPLVNIAPDGQELYAVPLGRIFRPGRARFAGRLHEQVQPVRPGQGELRLKEVTRDVVQLRHLGYRDPVLLQAKAERNLAIVTSEIETASGEDLARALYHRGRTLVTAGRIGEARGDLEQLLALPVRVPEQVWGRDVLIQLLLATGDLQPVAALVDRLRADGVDAGWCAWLQARALLAKERWAEALPLLRSIDELVDAVGRRHDRLPVLEAQLMAAGRIGAVDEATACCISLMAGHGRAEGLGPLLLTLWGVRPTEWLVELLAGAGAGHLEAVVTELARCDDPGPQVAQALLATV
jgi:hypothetical protein